MSSKGRHKLSAHLMKHIAILGSSGSIGSCALKVIKQHSKEFRLEALSVNKNIGVLCKQLADFNPEKIAVTDAEAQKKFILKKSRSNRFVYSGIDGLEKIAQDRDVDIVVIALSGAVALRPLLAAIEADKQIGLANKEALVIAGNIITERLKKSKAKIIPIDSEQSAIFQCLEGKGNKEVERLYLTASGGPLYDVPVSNFKYLKLKDILNHPRWKMGRKITVDSATLMNKGLEVIEARWLFDIDVSRIKVIVHREAIIHSMVEFIDGVVLAQLGLTDMSLPIQYALSYPRRLNNRKYHLDFQRIGSLTFSKVDTEKFPCLDFAYQAAKDGGSAPSVLNAANEEVVEAFLNKQISFISIPKIIEKVMSKHKVISNIDLDGILEADGWAREEAKRLIAKCCQTTKLSSY